jgi:predicted component of type VI protein secretion system
MKLNLIVAEGKHTGQVIPIEGPQFVIGRLRSCQMRAASTRISKQHCALRIRDDRVFVHDFDSANGTFVNGERIAGKRELRNEDCLKIGPLVLLVWIEAGVSAADSKIAAADESAIAALLLGPSADRASEMLDVAADSSFGSTVLMSPSPAESSQERRRKRVQKKSAPPASALDLPAAARGILEHYQQGHSG